MDHEYTRVNPRSRQLFAEQSDLVPGGYTHRARVLQPFPIFVERNVGAYKWDVTATDTSTTGSDMARCCSATRTRR